MASTKRQVSFPGVLRGQGHEATCTVLMTETSAPGSGLPPAYGQFSVRNVSKRLPDGEYTITVNGQTDKVRCQDGNWLAAI